MEGAQWFILLRFSISPMAASIFSAISFGSRAQSHPRSFSFTKPDKPTSRDNKTGVPACNDSITTLAKFSL